MFSKPLTLCSLKRYREIDNTHFLCVCVCVFIPRTSANFLFQEKEHFCFLWESLFADSRLLGIGKAYAIQPWGKSKIWRRCPWTSWLKSNSIPADCASRIFFRLFVHLSVRLSGRRKGCLEIQDICWWLQNKPEILSGWSFQNTIESELYWFVLGSILPPSVQF